MSFLTLVISLTKSCARFQFCHHSLFARGKEGGSWATFELIKAGCFGDKLERNIDGFPPRTLLGDIGFLLHTTHLVDVMLVITTGSGFPQLNNQRTDASDLA